MDLQYKNRLKQTCSASFLHQLKVQSQRCLVSWTGAENWVLCSCQSAWSPLAIVRDRNLSLFSPIALQLPCGQSCLLTAVGSMLHPTSLGQHKQENVVFLWDTMFPNSAVISCLKKQRYQSVAVSSGWDLSIAHKETCLRRAPVCHGHSFN